MKPQANQAFFEAYHASEKLAPLVREIGWSHNLVILEKCKDELECLFYLKMTRRYGWTKNVLIHQIEGGTYQLFLNNQTNFEQALPQKYKDQAKLAVKDSYAFDFLELADEHHELPSRLQLSRWGWQTIRSVIPYQNRWKESCPLLKKSLID